jgi:hypothetical protein
MSTIGEQVVKKRYDMLLRAQSENKDSSVRQTINVKTRGIKFQQTPNTTYNIQYRLSNSQGQGLM